MSILASLDRRGDQKPTLKPWSASRTRDGDAFEDGHRQPTLFMLVRGQRSQVRCSTLHGVTRIA